MKKLLVTMLGALMYLGCSGKIAGNVDETNTGVKTIFMSSGVPAANASISLFGTGDTSRTPVDKIFTDVNGKFDPVSLSLPEKAAYYNIQIESGSEAILLDSVLLSNANRRAIKSDTLAPTGSITGMVKIQKNHELRFAVVHALGTNKFVNVEPSGKFNLTGLGKGTYNLEFSMNAYPGKYGKVYKDTVVTASTVTTYADTIELPYADIPVVTGVKSVYDTSKGTSSISWNKIVYSQFRNYYVYRTDDYLSWSEKPHAKVTDTVYTDTLKDFGKYYWYRVAIENKSGVPGLTFDQDSVMAANPSLVHTTITSTVTHLGINKELGTQIESDETDQNGPEKTRFPVSKNDSVEIAIKVSNPTRKITSLFLGEEKNGVKDTMRTVRIFIAKDTSVIVGVIDNAGEIRRDTISFAVVEDAPMFVSIDSSATLNVQDTIRVQFSDVFGKIVSYKWKIGNEPEIITSLPELPRLLTEFGVTEASVTAIDDDGNSCEKDFTLVSVLEWEKIGKSPSRLKNLFIFKDAISGVDTLGNMWSSIDGSNWNQTTLNLPNGKRQFIEFNNDLYVVVTVDVTVENATDKSWSSTMFKQDIAGSWVQCKETFTFNLGKFDNPMPELTIANGKLLLKYIRNDFTEESKDGITWEKSRINIRNNNIMEPYQHISFADKLVETYLGAYDFDSYRYWGNNGDVSELRIPKNELSGPVVKNLNEQLIQIGYTKMSMFDFNTQRYYEIGQDPYFEKNECTPDYRDINQQYVVKNAYIYHLTSDGTIYKTK